jgi:hypothetical protein
MYEGCDFDILINTCYFLFIIVILLGIKCYFVVVFICISLLDNDLGHHFTYIIGYLNIYFEEMSI